PLLDPVPQVPDQQLPAVPLEHRHAGGRALPLADAAAPVYMERLREQVAGAGMVAPQLLEGRQAAHHLVDPAALRRPEAEQADVVQDRFPEGVVRVEAAVRVRDREADPFAYLLTGVPDVVEHGPLHVLLEGTTRG